MSLDAILENPLFAGGIGLAALGTTAALGRRALIQSARLLRRQLLVTVEISRTDPSYPWILAWLSKPRNNADAGFLVSRLTRIRELAVSTSTQQIAPGGGPGGGGAGGSGPVKAHFALVPGYGRYVMRHAPGVYIAVDRAKLGTADMQTGKPYETLTLTTLWAHRHVFESVFREAHELVRQAEEGRTIVYTVSGFNWARLGEPRPKRPLGSVVLDEGVKERIVDDVKDFLGSQQWYLDRGVPYRRGYLLHGPPGSGKTSFIQALAGELDYGIAIVNLSERGLTDDKLAAMLMKLPERTFLLLEDADAAFVNRQQAGADGYSGASVTFSGLLNALDGLSAGEERVAFLTTNHIERLDPALIRPGRVDRIEHLGAATRYQAGQLWDRFYGDVDTDGIGRGRFLAKLDEIGLFRGEKYTSAAAIQGLFLFNKEDMNGAISMAEGIVIPASAPEA